MQRTSQNGTYRLDRVFPGVGRIAVASGATTKEEYKKRNALLTRLYDQGRLKLLQSIRAGTLTVTEVYAAARADELDSLTGDRARLAANLWDAVAAWTPTSASAAATRRRFATSFTGLKRSRVLGPTATVDDLQGVDWRALETTWTGGSSDWNHLRRAISHFLTVYLGDVHHPVRRSVMRVF